MARDASAPTSLSLLERARSQDDEAWHQLVHLYGPLVHRWCKRAGLNDEDVADVFQETFRAVSKNLDTFKPSRSVGSFRSWLRTIARTKTADHFRRLNKQPNAPGGTEAQLQMADIADPFAEDSDDEAADDNALIVQRAMDLIKPEFNPQNWKAFQLVTIEGQSAVEVAENMKVNAQAVRQSNYRIRRRLRVVLKDLVE